jgi:hypothetical protein
MRFIALVSGLLVSIAYATTPNIIDLDKPGVLEQLKLSHPQKYQAVTAVLHASEEMPCKSRELEALKVRLDIRDLECNLVILTSYPAKRHVSFEFDGTSYTATVVLKGTEDFKVRSAIETDAGAAPKR